LQILTLIHKIFYNPLVAKFNSENYNIIYIKYIRTQKYGLIFSFPGDHIVTKDVAKSYQQCRYHYVMVNKAWFPTTNQNSDRSTGSNPSNQSDQRKNHVTQTLHQWTWGLRTNFRLRRSRTLIGCNHAR